MCRFFNEQRKDCVLLLTLNFIRVFPMVSLLVITFSTQKWERRGGGGGGGGG